MKRILSIVRVGLAVAALLPAVTVSLMILWSYLEMSTSVQRFFEVLGSLVEFFLPLAAGISVAWLAARWRRPIIGVVAGALGIELGYAVAAELSMNYSEPSPDAGFILVLPIFFGPMYILALAGGMSLVGQWRKRANSKRLSS